VLAWPTEQLLYRSTVQDPGQGSATTSETRFTPTTLLLAAPIDALQRADSTFASQKPIAQRNTPGVAANPSGRAYSRDGARPAPDAAEADPDASYVRSSSADFSPRLSPASQIERALIGDPQNRGERPV
jgi:hypothetical protein